MKNAPGGMQSLPEFMHRRTVAGDEGWSSATRMRPGYRAEQADTRWLIMVR